MPVKPAPTIATSASVSPGSGSPGASAPGTVSCQRDSCRYASAGPMRSIVAGARPRRASGMLGGMNADEPASGKVPPPHDPAQPYRICTVCLGNICRSPTAEVVLRNELRKAGLDGKVVVDSAGMGDWHLGEPMHPEA